MGTYKCVVFSEFDNVGIVLLQIFEQIGLILGATVGITLEDTVDTSLAR